MEAEAAQRVVDLVPTHAERDRHALAAIEGSAPAIRGDRQQHHHRHGVWPDLGEPAVVQQG
ncbi:MAG: hypothetical protein ACK52I_17335, partial [Pseudomonadota bacterium]